MNKIVKRVMTMIGAGVMELSLLAPVTGVSAASRNQAVEIPVSFLKAESAIQIDGGLNLNDASAEGCSGGLCNS